MIERYERVTSTMEVARDRARAGCAHGTFVVAREQTAGRGRHGRQWASAPGCGFYGTLVWRPVPKQASCGLPVAVGIALVEMLNDWLEKSAPAASKAQLKWPNDVWVNGAKLAGVLMEAVDIHTADGFLLVGIGVNLSDPKLRTPQGIVPPTHLTQLMGPRHADPKTNVGDEYAGALAQRLMPALAETYALFCAEGFRPFVSRFANVDALRGAQVTATVLGTLRTGRAAGITSEGQLLLVSQGRALKLEAGEVSLVRPVRPEAARSNSSEKGPL